MIQNSFYEKAPCISTLFEILIYISLISKLQTILYFSYLRTLHFFRVSFLTFFCTFSTLPDYYAIILSEIIF